MILSSITIAEAILALAAGSVAGVAIAIEKGLAGLIALVINLFAKLIGLGGLSKKVMAIFGKVRKRIDRVINKLLKKAQKVGRKLMGKLGIGAKEKPKNPKEHDEQVKAGMQYLHQQEKVLDKDGDKSLTQEEANKVASKTKKKFAVFTSITPRAVGGKWVYDWKGSNGTEKGAKVEGTGKTKMEPAIEVLPTFKCKKTLDEVEFSKQLNGQQDAINKMTVLNWIENRDAFLSRKDMAKQAGKKTVSGRDPAGDKKAKEIRDNLLNEYRLKLLEEEPSLSSDRIELEKRVKAYGDTRAVIHRVDQIAGGSGTDIMEDDLGDARIDYSLGAQWRGKRINGLDAKIRNDFPDKSGEKVKMNVRLNYITV